jgi:hypothetical protein
MGMGGAKDSLRFSALTVQCFNRTLRWHENGNEARSMKIKCFTMAIAVASFELYVHAQDTYMQTNAPAQSAAYTADYVNKVGVGAEFGAPIGVNAKYWLTDTFAVDGAIGWSPYSHSTAEIHVDFLVHDFDLLNPATGRLPVYAGVGILGRFRDDRRSNLAGFRFPIGISYMFEDCPLDFYAEIAPEAIFAAFGRLSVDGAVGFRYWF